MKITENITRKEIKDTLLSNKAIYTISPSLFKRPDYWNDNLKILGFHERDKTINWQPDKDLIDFLKRHDQILLITNSFQNPQYHLD